MRLLSLCIALLCAEGVAAQSTRFDYERPANSAEATLRVVTAQGKIYTQQFAAGQPVALTIALADGSTLADGTHRWELSYAPQLSAAQRTQALNARRNGDTDTPTGWPSALAVRSGVVYVRDGRFQPMLENETGSASGKSSTGAEPLTVTPASSAGQAATKDQVIADDLIVQGSICSGFDCVNNETFGSDTIRMKENNTRIKFEDTSIGSFPTVDWQLTANDSASGAASRFSIEDIDNSRVPFTLSAGAASNSIFVDSTGRVGFRTSTPVLDLHINTSNTPALRLDQNNSGGFTAQVWDVAANEANFFVRDVTGGSRLPFRIRPGAPTSAIDISASGDVGMGIASPNAAVDVRRGADPGTAWLTVARGASASPPIEDLRMQLDPTGNLYVSGTITQLSSRTSKTNFLALAGDEVLARLSELPIWTWNYLSADADDRHIGPVAEDFYAAFGFGRSERSLAPADVAGVALAATQALQQQVAERDQRIAELEARLSRLEAALEHSADAPR